MTEFSSLHEGVLQNYKRSELLQKFVVQNECNKYLVFNTVKDYIAYENNLRNSDIDPGFHEIIFSEQKRKFFLDIDHEVSFESNPYELYDISLKKYNDHILMIKEIMVKVFNSIYDNDNISIDDIAEVTAHTDHEYIKNNRLSALKFSSNLILMTYCMPNYAEFKYYGNEILKTYKELQTRHVIDEGFFMRSNNNSFIQNRLIRNTKYKMRSGSEDNYSVKRFKCVNGILPSDYEALRYFISNVIDLPVVDEHYVEEQDYDEVEVDDEKIQEILNNTKHVWSNNFIYRSHKGGRILFDRIASSYCDFCDRIHTKDNTLYLSIAASGTIFRKCLKSKDKYEILSHGKQIEKPVQQKQDICKPIRQNVTEVDEKTIDIEKAFVDKKFNIIKAEMKMGKSKALLQYINDNNERYKKIVFISFRRTFSAEASMKYSQLGFRLYSMIDGDIDTNVYPRIIIQVESLSRIKFPIHDVDLVILDEIESIWSQFSSKNFIDYNMSVSIFKILIETSHKVVCMDANICKRTYDILKYIIKDFDANVHTYINKYNPCADYTYNLLRDKNIWLVTLKQFICDGKNIAIFTNSLKEAKLLNEFVCKYVAAELVMMYNSKTKESIKQEHFRNVNAYWSKYRIVICTPTVSAGISFEASHFDYVFGYFCDLSCNVETCRQMLCRVRNVKSSEIFICVSAQQKDYETNVAEIKRNMTYHRDKIVSQLKNYNMDVLYCEINNNLGYVQYMDTLTYKIITENIAFDNKSRNNFYLRIKSQLHGKHLSQQAKVITEAPSIMQSIINDIAAEYQTVRNNEEDKNINSVMNAATITRDNYSQLLDNMRTQKDITESELFSMEKYKLLDNTQLTESELQTHIVKQFTKKSACDKLSMNRYIFKSSVWSDAIADIEKHDIEKYAKYSGVHNAEATNNYSSSAHKCCYEQHLCALLL